MLKQPRTKGHAFQPRLLLAAPLAACLFFLALTALRQPPPNRDRLPFKDSGGPPPSTDVKTGGGGPQDGTPKPQLEGAAAREYLAKTEDGRSLAQAVTAARFGLKWQEHSPFESSTNLSLSNRGGGYLGMSHVQNLNAWFDDEGVTVRPTLAKEERTNAWRLGMKLKAYGYGAQLIEAPPIISHKVKENRIEYQRDDCDPKLVEWYENRAAGIEQGFILNAPPERDGVDNGEPLRLVVALEGDLCARAKQDGSEVELFDQRGDRVLSYSQLTATDASGHKLAARLQTNVEGSEISLAVDDRGAAYPIDIDPITASLEQKLTKPNTAQAGTEFGDAVAISGNTAVLGAFREDFLGNVDAGVVYIFTRTGSTWTFKYSSTLSNSPSAQCGWSVAVNKSGDRAAFGCPGNNSNTGFAELLLTNSNWSTASGLSVTPPSGPRAGDRFGESVAMDGDIVVVGAPFNDSPLPPPNNFQNDGAFYHFLIDADLPGFEWTDSNFLAFPAEAHLGASIAIYGADIIVGAPGMNSQTGAAQMFLSDPGSTLGLSKKGLLSPSDGAPGDLFGYSVAISGDTAVVGAPLNDNAKGTDAGAAYVFVRDQVGNWTQQQKLIASDGIDQDQFGESVAIEGNTIVVGSPYNGSKTFVGTRGNGRSYVFTRNIDTWSQQTIISALFDGAPVDKFGIAVALSGNTVISGAEHAEPGGTTDAGAAWVHRLSCVPPYGAKFDILFSTPNVCPGRPLTIVSTAVSLGSGGLSIQWRKNGVNIPGATSGDYFISSASASDAGTYDYIVTNSCGGEISTPFTLTVFNFAVFPTSFNVGTAGTSGNLAVTTNASCPWTAQSNAAWITITSGASGTGNGNVGFRIDANGTTSQRTGTITVGVQTVTVTQDAALPPNAVQFSSSNYSVQEDCTTVTITVNRTGDTSGAASVDYATSDVTATERRDYIKTLGTLNFAPGETTKSFGVLINEDSIVEGNETFNVSLNNPSGVSLGGPAIAAVTIIDDPSEPSTNAIDDAQSFVCQHYHDFLNRQPDAAGLAFWTTNITSCGSEPSCIETKRTNVSAAFYLSIEFQQTGFLVERLYKTAFGSVNASSTFGGTHTLPAPVVRLDEFLSDTQRIGQGVVVGQTGWETVLENNKQAFASEFAQRSRFITALPATLTPAQFVDALNANAGNPLSQSERDQLVNDLAANVKTRAQVLRAVAEHPNLVNAEFNRAFVLMQFFGYLRRNPNDPQDTDYTGYDFWLTKLNQFAGDFQNAEMVKAFISSIEYRQRFGP